MGDLSLVHTRLENMYLSIQTIFILAKYLFFVVGGCGVVVDHIA
jgi:hypothetical protein